MWDQLGGGRSVMWIEGGGGGGRGEGGLRRKKKKKMKQEGKEKGESAGVE